MPDYTVKSHIDAFLKTDTLSAARSSLEVPRTSDFQSLCSTVQASSANWSSAYTTVCATSANWSSAYTTVCATSANWSSAYTAVSPNSANWNSVYSTVCTTSANWDWKGSALPLSGTLNIIQNNAIDDDASLDEYIIVNYNGRMRTIPLADNLSTVYKLTAY